MKQITSRPYENTNDLQSMGELLGAVRPFEYLHDYPSKVNLEEDLASAIVRANTRLWFDEAQPVAWAYVDEFNNLLWEIAPAYEAALGAQVVAWGESCVRKGLAHGAAGALDANCREDNTARITWLEYHGFERTGNTNVIMSRDLSEAIPAAKLPAGFRIRPLAGTHEAEAVAAMHRAAFGTEYMTTANRLAIMATSEYDLSLDLVVLAPDGTIAANCICSADEATRTGSTDPVFVHPAHQRQGLARALLLSALGLLKERGMRSARLGTSGDNIAMQKAAEAAGFTVAYRTVWFSKKVG